MAGKISEGTGKLTSVVGYMNSQFDRSITWKDAEEAIKRWGRFAIKGVMSVEDAKRAVDTVHRRHDFQSWRSAVGWLDGTVRPAGADC